MTDRASAAHWLNTSPRQRPWSTMTCRKLAHEGSNASAIMFGFAIKQKQKQKHIKIKRVSSEKGNEERRERGIHGHP